MKKYMKVCNKLIEELGKKAGKARIKKADEECLARLRVKYQREALEERRRNRGRKRKSVDDDEESDLEEELDLYDD